MLVAMSRATSVGKLGLQVANASRASSTIDVRSSPTDGATGTLISIATKVVQGALAPAAPNAKETAASYGGPLDRVNLEVLSAGSTLPSLYVPWATATQQGGVSALEDGHGYTLVVIGPRTGVSASLWWNASTISLVPSDPEP